MDWSRKGLQEVGFRGFVTFEELPAADVPRGAGVYIVLRPAKLDPTFLRNSLAGHFKGRNPTVSKEHLEFAWVPGAQVLYIGKAATGKDPRRGLRKRLDEYRRYGAGQPVGHQGGRYVWQLADWDELRIAWLETPDRDPGDVEGELIADFIAVHGVRPFANRNRGRQGSSSAHVS